jgi:hypothetical protein
MMTTNRTAYELLLNKSTNAVEQHYCISEVEVSNIISDSNYLTPNILNRNNYLKNFFLLLFVPIM